MAKVRLERIEEAANNLIMNSRISLLQESEGLDEKTRAKSELLIHESVRYIKGQLLQGGILEEAQNVLADVWTQAILEDIDLSSIGELGNKIAGGVQGLGHGLALAAGGEIGSAHPDSIGQSNLGALPGLVKNIAANGYDQGYNPNVSMSDTYNLAHGVTSITPGEVLTTGATIGALGGAAYGGAKLLGRVRRAGQTK